MTRFRIITRMALVLTALIISADVGVATPIQWNAGAGHNDHWYEVILVSSGITWENAQADAISRSGYLATILSAEENSFVFSLVDSPSFWIFESGSGGANLGPWIGGFQQACTPEASCGWQWVNSDGAFAYTNWHGGEPNDGYDGESRLHYFEYGGTSGFWNDLGADNEFRPAGYTIPIAYVVEYDRIASVPEPASLLLLGSGSLLLVSQVRRLRRNINH